MMIDRWIAEATEYDFKVALEVKKPKAGSKASVPLQTASAARCFSGLMMTET
ncbi:MAG: hypothetical protein ACLRR6_08295 [Oscillospiraceae bacterium]